MRTNWDIFCRVVDNFGDIGVTWRLARQLVAEYHVHVRLWVDDLNAFYRICPSANKILDVQVQHGVSIHYWSAEWDEMHTPADVVIEAFACELPASYISAMSKRTTPSLWLNLEYLSAESWVEGCHGLPSPQANGLQKFFFFPGFTEATGGLLREKDLIEQRIQFQNSTEKRLEFLERIDVSPLKNARIISLFCYENPNIGNWLNNLASASQPTHLLVPEGKILRDINVFNAGDITVCGALTIQVLPFLNQVDYDQLLWSCDFNIVRGEDSFVRAQWAGKPMLWHIYPQDEDTHIVKLDAFLEHYFKSINEGADKRITDSVNPDTKNDICALWHAWNTHGDIAEIWPSIERQWPALTSHAETWCLSQSLQKNLAKSLVQFSENWV